MWVRTRVLGWVLGLGLSVLGAKIGLSAPNAHFLPNLFINQAKIGTTPNQHAAWFKFLDPSNPDRVAEEISLADAFNGGEVVLEPGEPAFAVIGWFMFILNDCDSLTLRPVVDFESPQCQIPEEADPEDILAAIAALPEECLAPALEDPCGTLEGTPLHFDFATSMANARQTLTKEIQNTMLLDGEELDARNAIKPYREFISQDFNCAVEVHNSPIYLYFAYGYAMASPTGSCIAKSTAAALPPLEPGPHDFVFLSEVGSDVLEFPPITILQL